MLELMDEEIRYKKKSEAIKLTLLKLIEKTYHEKSNI